MCFSPGLLLEHPPGPSNDDDDDDGDEDEEDEEEAGVVLANPRGGDKCRYCYYY